MKRPKSYPKRRRHRHLRSPKEKRASPARPAEAPIPRILVVPEARPPKRRRRRRERLRKKKIAAAAAASQAVDALAPADIGRTRGGTRKLQDEDEHGPPVEPPRPFWVGVADSDYRARMATLPARRPAATCPQQRLAEIYGLSDSEDEDLYPADQPDLPYTAAWGAPDQGSPWTAG